MRAAAWRQLAAAADRGASNANIHCWSWRGTHHLGPRVMLRASWGVVHVLECLRAKRQDKNVCTGEGREYTPGWWRRQRSRCRRWCCRRRCHCCYCWRRRWLLQQRKRVVNVQECRQLLPFVVACAACRRQVYGEQPPVFVLEITTPFIIFLLLSKPKHWMYFGEELVDPRYKIDVFLGPDFFGKRVPQITVHGVKEFGRNWVGPQQPMILDVGLGKPHHCFSPLVFVSRRQDEFGVWVESGL